MLIKVWLKWVVEVVIGVGFRVVVEVFVEVVDIIDFK